MIDENYINSIYEKFSIEDDEVLINKFKEINAKMHLIL